MASSSWEGCYEFAQEQVLRVLRRLSSLTLLPEMVFAGHMKVPLTGGARASHARSGPAAVYQARLPSKLLEVFHRNFCCVEPLMLSFR